MTSALAKMLTTSQWQSTDKMARRVLHVASHIRQFSVPSSTTFCAENNTRGTRGIVTIVHTLVSARTLHGAWILAVGKFCAASLNTAKLGFATFARNTVSV
jgi:hypothetical protein